MMESIKTETLQTKMVNFKIITDMKKFNILLFLTLIIFLTSCDKSYKYIETVSKESSLDGIYIKEKEEIIIKAKDDSTAYLEAFKRFCISIKVNKDIAQSIGGNYSTPLSFKLLNEKGEDITNTTLFEGRTRGEKEIEVKIFSMKNITQKQLPATRGSK